MHVNVGRILTICTLVGLSLSTAFSQVAGADSKRYADNSGVSTVPSPYVSQDSHPLTPQGKKGEGVPDFWVRPGLSVTRVAHNLKNARFMCFDSNGTLYVSRPDRGDIIMLRKSGSDYAVSGTFVSGYSKPHGMFFKDGWLWFTSDGKVNKARITNGTQPASNVVNVLSDLPEGGHWWRSILVTDSYFYTSIGDDGNINDDTQTDREKIWRYNLDGSGKHLFSSGIRNTEKLWVRPGTTSIYGWDEGSDWYGAKAGDKDHDQPITDWNPPEEFNHYVDGGFYGHPFLMGTRVPRLEYLSKPEIIELANKTIPPAWCGGPHWAAVGWTFIQKKNPLNLTVGDCIVAFHGSWNRSNPSGYRVELLQFDPVIGIPIGSKMLVGTVDSNGNVAGRPVDVVQAPDGSFLFSDDRNNAIYRISASN